MNTATKSSIFKTAWSYLKQGLFKSFGDALKAAWNRFKIIAKLKSGIAYFSYKNSEGKTREAIGTLLTGNFRLAYTFNDHTDGKLDVIRYWDIVRRGIRSFRIERLTTTSA